MIFCGELCLLRHFEDFLVFRWFFMKNRFSKNHQKSHSLVDIFGLSGLFHFACLMTCLCYIPGYMRVIEIRCSYTKKLLTEIWLFWDIFRLLRSGPKKKSSLHYGSAPNFACNASLTCNKLKFAHNLFSALKLRNASSLNIRETSLFWTS